MREPKDPRKNDMLLKTVRYTREIMLTIQGTQPL
jgi:hypothetical protein